MKRKGLATLVGTFTLVLWGMLFWGLLAPRLDMFNALPDARGVTRILEASGTQTGTYFMPWPRDTPEEFDASSPSTSAAPSTSSGTCAKVLIRTA